MTKKEEKARRLIMRADKEEAKGKLHYDKARDLITKAALLVGHGGRVRMDDTHVAVVTDQFEEAVKSEKDVVWAHGAARRWKVDIKAA